MRIRHTVDVHITSDGGTSSSLFGPDNLTSKALIDSMSSFTSGAQSIPASATENVAFADVADARGIYLRANGQCEISVNGGAPLTLRPATASGTAKLFFEGELTSVSIENTGTSPLSCVYVIWGA